MAKKDVPAFIHDSNAHRDPKLIQLRMAHGFEGIGIYWTLIEVLREQTDLCLSESELKAMDFSLNLGGKLHAVVDSCLELGLLVKDSGFVHSYSLDERMDRYEAKRKKASEAGKVGAVKRWQKVETPEPVNSDRIATLSEKDGDPIGSDSLRETKLEPEPEVKTEPEPEGEDADPYLVEAERHLEQANDQPWTRSSAWIAAQRRPMKKYPSVFLSSVELANVLKVYADKIPKSKLKIAFQACQAQIANQQVATGKKPETVAAFNHLIGFHYQNLLDALRKEEQLEQTEARRA